MNDQLEQNLREAFAERDAQLDGAAVTRLRALEYHPRRRRRLPAFGAAGVAGLAATAGTIVALGSSAAPAFAGWQSTPTTPAASQLAQAQQDCGQGLGSPVLTDSRGPYTAAIYAQSNSSSVCLAGNGVSIDSSASSTSAAPTLAADGIQFGGGGMRDGAGDALTLSDGRVGSAVTAVTLDLSDGSSVQATVSGGWYLAWWPGDVTATNAQVTTAAGTNTVSYPAAPALPAPSCPTGASSCSVGYGFGGAGKGQGTTQISGGSSQSGSN